MPLIIYYPQKEKVPRRAGMGIGTTQLAPGKNYFLEETWDKIKDFPTVQTKVKSGIIKLFELKADDNESGVDIRKFNVDEAADIISSTEDEQELLVFIEQEKANTKTKPRKSIFDSIKLRLKQLKALAAMQ